MKYYSKHKDDSPAQTVLNIQKILHDAGLFHVMEWTETKDIKLSVSCRVTLYPTKLGANGKGTDKFYASAIAYAELMERMQNGTLRRPHSKEDYCALPDVKLMSASEILAQGSIFFDVLFKDLDIDGEFFRELWLKNFFENKEICVVPFADIARNKIIWFPSELLVLADGANGMAAGNNLEEALVQGFSEIFERYVHTKVILGEVVPPEIPREYLEQFAIYNLIQEFESSGRYKVKVLDGSLGRGFPVAASVITDQETGNFKICFGAHPSFNIAVERTLTETLQGRKTLEDASSACVFGNETQVHNLNNINNIMSIGSGFYSYNLMLKEPDWKFIPWGAAENASNTEILKNIFALLKRENMTPLIRDASTIGFPACWIVVPGVNTIFTANNLIARIKAYSSKRDLLARLAANKQDEQTERLLMNYILFDEYNFYSGNKLFDDKIQVDRLGAFLALKLGDYEKSKHFFEKLIKLENDETERDYLSVMLKYVNFLKLILELTV
ncbi:MAG: YcaO-like family protein [Synergistaceae bacterium]|nr:YcaO-like family protein [Synergistaceae bacterium]